MIIWGDSMSSNKTIKFDYDSINTAYNKLLQVQREAKSALDKLEN